MPDAPKSEPGGPSPVSPEFIDLFHHRWSVPILGALQEAGGGDRLVVLRRRLGVGRDSLGRTVEALSAAGLVRPNPGYGHPMRPEVMLTEEGRRLAAPCRSLVDRLQELEAVEVGLRKWSLPVVRALDQEDRFTGVRDRLPGITPRALTHAFKRLEEATLLDRRVEEDWPPAVLYRLTSRGARLLPPVRELQRAL